MDREAEQSRNLVSQKLLTTAGELGVSGHTRFIEPTEPVTAEFGDLFAKTAQLLAAGDTGAIRQHIGWIETTAMLNDFKLGDRTKTGELTDQEAKATLLRRAGEFGAAAVKRKVEQRNSVFLNSAPSQKPEDKGKEITLQELFSETVKRLSQKSE